MANTWNTLVIVMTATGGEGTGKKTHASDSEREIMFIPRECESVLE